MSISVIKIMLTIINFVVVWIFFEFFYKYMDFAGRDGYLAHLCKLEDFYSSFKIGLTHIAESLNEADPPYWIKQIQLGWYRLVLSTWRWKFNIPLPSDNTQDIFLTIKRK